MATALLIQTLHRKDILGLSVGVALVMGLLLALHGLKLKPPTPFENMFYILCLVFCACLPLWLVRMIADLLH